MLPLMEQILALQEEGLHHLQAHLREQRVDSIHESSYELQGAH